MNLLKKHWKTQEKLFLEFGFWPKSYPLIILAPFAKKISKRYRSNPSGWSVSQTLATALSQSSHGRCVLTSVPLTYVWAFGFVGCIWFITNIFISSLSLLYWGTFAQCGQARRMVPQLGVNRDSGVHNVLHWSKLHVYYTCFSLQHVSVAIARHFIARFTRFQLHSLKHSCGPPRCQYSKQPQIRRFHAEVSQTIII